MTIAFWCVLIGAVMPILWTGIAKFTGRPMGPRDNLAPRDFLETLDGYRKRAHWAQLNAFEAFPGFAAGVIIATVAGGAPDLINALAVLWVVLRLLYGVLYLANVGLARTLVWGGAFATMVALFFTPVMV